MAAAAPPTNEHLRILRAASEGRLASKTGTGRWCITPKITGEWSMETEPLPDHRARRRLIARGLLDYPRLDPPPSDRPYLRIDSSRLVLTDKGREVLAAHPHRHDCPEDGCPGAECYAGRIDGCGHPTKSVTDSDGGRCPWGPVPCPDGTPR